MKNLICFIFLFVLFGSLTIGLGSEGPTHRSLPPLHLGVGEQRLIQIPQLKKFTVGAPLVRALPLPLELAHDPQSAHETLMLKGIKPGRTDLWIWKEDGSTESRPILISKWNRRKLPAKLAPLAESLREVEVIPFSDQILLRGQITQRQEAHTILKLLEVSPQAWVDQTTFSPGLHDEIEGDLRGTLLNESESKVELEREGKHYRLIFREPPDPLKVKKLHQKLQEIYPGVTPFEETSDSGSAVFRVYLVETHRRVIESFGINLPDRISSQLTYVSNQIKKEAQLELALDTLSQKGELEILSNPQISVEIPGKAELFSGGSIPIPVKSRFYSNIDWKRFGLLLQLETKAIRSKKVQLTITTEVSFLDPSLSRDDIPGLQSNRMQTQVQATFGEPLFLCGLYQTEKSQNEKGIPVLRDIPIIGGLFGTKSEKKQQTELLAILVPNRQAPPQELAAWEIDFPKGPTPVPRNWVSPHEAKKLKASSNYPWNVLE